MNTLTWSFRGHETIRVVVSIQVDGGWGSACSESSECGRLFVKNTRSKCFLTQTKSKTKNKTHKNTTTNKKNKKQKKHEERRILTPF